MIGRALVITTSYPAYADDPAGHFVRSECLGMAASGTGVTVLCPLRTCAVTDERVTVRALGGGDAFGWPGLGPRLRQNPLRAFGARAFAARVRRTVVEEGRSFDAVVLHWPFPLATVLSPTLGRSRRTVELVSHGACVRALLALPRPMRTRWVRMATRHASAWRFVSTELLGRLLDSLDGPARADVGRIAVVAPSSLGLDPLERPTPRASNEAAVDGDEAQPSSKPFAVVGRLVRKKRVDIALHHVAHLAQAASQVGSPPPHLVVVGDGPEGPALRSLAQALGIDVDWKGQLPRTKALALLRESRGLMFASEAEGAPTVLREARVLGVPVIDLRT
jgi:glycosyltransferase involved in cell wall biosynthesis